MFHKVKNSQFCSYLENILIPSYITCYYVPQKINWLLAEMKRPLEQKHELLVNAMQWWSSKIPMPITAFRNGGRSEYLGGPIVRKRLIFKEESYTSIKAENCVGGAGWGLFGPLVTPWFRRLCRFCVVVFTHSGK